MIFDSQVANVLQHANLGIFETIETLRFWHSNKRNASLFPICAVT